MKFALPTRINLYYAIVFASVVFTVQIIEGTDTVFASLFWLYIMVSVVAFNVAGGFVHPSGAFVFFNATLTAIFGLTYKLFLGEPGESNLMAPRVTMSAYVLGMVMIALAIALVRKLVPKRGLLERMGSVSQYQNAAIGALVIGWVFIFTTYTFREQGTLISALQQVNNLPGLAIVLATFYEVKQSKGQRSTNWVVWTGMGLFTFMNGFLNASKQGLAQGPVSYLLTAIVAGYSFTRKQLVVIILGFIVFQLYLAPYSQISRQTRLENPTLADDWNNTLLYIGKLEQTREEYKALEEDQEDLSLVSNGLQPHLYNEPQGFIDRLNMLSPDDALVSYTEQGNVEGLYPTYIALLKVIPRFVWRNKPDIGIGNLYGRELGIIDTVDETTGVSFSPIADAFHEERYWGVFVLTPLVIFVLCYVMDSLSGDIRVSPWGILFTVVCAHQAPEGLLAGQIYESTYTALGIVVFALIANYVLPTIVGALTNQDRTRVRRGVEFKPVQAIPVKS